MIVIQGWMEDGSSLLWRIAPPSDSIKNEDGADVMDFVGGAHELCTCKEVSVTEVAGNVYYLPSTEAVIRYLQAALGFPVKATLLKVSTKDKLGDNDPLNPEESVDEVPQPLGHREDVYIMVYDATKKAMYTDQMGRFPITSSHGHKYVMVTLELDGNYIDAEPMTARTSKELSNWSHLSQLACSDNEAPAELKTAIWINNCFVELTPTDIHRWNIADWAIQTFKGHFISILAGTNDHFTLHEWDQLLPQTVTLHLLWQSNVSPHVSAYAHHHGHFNYDQTPLAPMGCAVQFNENPNCRWTFGEHSADGWYITTSTEHYRVHKVLVKKTRHLRLSDTVYFRHKYLTQPTVTPGDRIMQAILDFTRAIKDKINNKAAGQFAALIKLAEVFQPGNRMPILLTGDQPPPRVPPTDPPPSEQPAEPLPRVQKLTSQPQPHSTPPRVQPQPTTMPISSKIVPQALYVPRLIVKSQPDEPEPDSIASRLLSRCKQQQQQPRPPQDSIASRLLAQRRAQEATNLERNFQSQIVPGLWTHKTHPTLSALVVDDFSIKYFSGDDLEHLIKTLRQ
ncbi:hypothetical protein ACHAW6_014204 [Cyclotella cf. meneghiniana]